MKDSSGKRIRRFTGGGPRPDKREKRQAEAEQRKFGWELLSREKQLAWLDSLFGKGKGAARQRARLA